MKTPTPTKVKMSALDKRQSTEHDAQKEAALIELREHCEGNERSTQCRRFLTGLRRFPTISTIEARRCLDILHPAGRIKELRDEGHEIITLWQTVETEAGNRHRIGRYTLVRR